MEKKTIRRLVIVLLCILLNLTGKIIAVSMDLPIWLDTVGTFLAAYYVGPFGAILAGVSSNLLFSVIEGVPFIYILMGLVTALAVSFIIRKGWFNSLTQVLLASFWVGILCAVILTPLNMLIQDGYPRNYWGDALFDMLLWYKVPRVLCALAGEAAVEIVDKPICMLIVFIAIWALDKRKAKKQLPLLLVAGLLVGLFGWTDTVYAESLFSSNYYVESMYNNRNGMMASEANVIGETADGYIWIGSYAGLTRYDGKEFQFIRDGGIVSVTCMLTDAKGRLWIGTNSDGVARYENGTFTFFKTTDGLSADSIRCFAEAENGTIYVGTTDKLCKINDADEIETISSDMTFIVSMAFYEGNLVCVGNNGKLSVLDGDGRELPLDASAEGIYYRCAVTASQTLFAGTTEGNLCRLDLSEGKVKIAKKTAIPLNDVVALEEDGEGNLWMCGEQGFGYLDESGTFHEKHYENFDSSFAWIHEDYQGNLWVASTRYGVLKLSKGRFIDIFDEAGVAGAVVNAFTCYRGDYYCGTDTGLIVLDGKSLQRKYNVLTDVLTTDRIRCLLVDSQNNLWVCTYGDYGLACYSGGEDVVFYNVETKQTTTNRFRCVAELRDGTIAAGTADGINFIRDGEVVGRITEADGLDNSQILSLAEGEDGRLYAGSDGAGIYVIENRQIVEHITTDDGLSSGVILRIVPCEGGFLVVTGNALVFMGDEIRVLRDFPYFNNYDIMIAGETAYVLSSAGVYEVNLQGLCGDAPMRYRLYGANDGLAAGLTVNAWNYADENGSLFFCTNSGVVVFQEQQTEQNVGYRYGVSRVLCDGEEVLPQGGVISVPARTQSVTIEASVRNYALMGDKVRFYIEGAESSPETYDFDRIEPIQLYNFPHGEYRVHMEIVDSMGEKVLSEKIFQLRKEAQAWENRWFPIYVVLLCMEGIIFLMWTALVIYTSSRRKMELERQHGELEEKVAEQMQEMDSLFLQAVTALSEAVDAKDRYTSGHSKRVAAYAKMLAARMGKSEKEQEEIYFAGLLHDVGKISIPENVINKPDSLTVEEAELFKIHPVTGYHILKGISGNRSIADGARFHHECYDGSGYPNGLRGGGHPGDCQNHWGGGRLRCHGEQSQLQARSSAGGCAE